MRIDELMTRDVVAVRPETPLKDVARLLMKHRIGGVPVVDEDNVVLGVISESDFVIKEMGSDYVTRSRLDRLLGRANRESTRAAARTAGEAMSKPAISIDNPFASVREAAITMLEHN